MKQTNIEWGTLSRWVRQTGSITQLTEFIHSCIKMNALLLNLSLCACPDVLVAQPYWGAALWPFCNIDFGVCNLFIFPHFWMFGISYTHFLLKSVKYKLFVLAGSSPAWLVSIFGYVINLWVNYITHSVYCNWSVI